MESKSRLFDLGLVIVAGVQAALIEVPTNIWRTFIENPIEATIGIFTICLLYQRTMRMRQKRMITKREIDSDGSHLNASLSDE